MKVRDISRIADLDTSSRYECQMEVPRGSAQHPFIVCGKTATVVITPRGCRRSQHYCLEHALDALEQWTTQEAAR